MPLSNEQARSWLEDNGASLEVDKPATGGSPVWTLIARGMKVSLEVSGGARSIDDIARELVEKAQATP